MYRNHLLPCLQKLAYDSTAGVNPPDGLGGLIINWRTCASQRLRNKALFLRPIFALSSMAGCVGTPKGVPVPVDRSANLAQSVTLTCLAASGDGSSETTGTITMHTLSLRLHALNPSRIQRAKAHRAMALAALRSDSSLKNRLSRYNYHTEKARQLEIAGGVQ